MRFLIGEDLSPTLAAECHQAGDDGTSVRDRNMLQAGDREVSALCFAEGRVLVTNNARDFLELAEQEGVHPGLVFLPLGSQKEMREWMKIAIAEIERLAAVAKSSPAAGSGNPHEVASSSHSRGRFYIVAGTPALLRAGRFPSVPLVPDLMSPPKYVDLIALVAALGIFLLGGFPLLGYAVAAAAWLAQRGLQTLANRRMKEHLRAGNRQKAMGIVAGTTLGRVWLMATAVLLVGLAERESGLAAAVLLAALFTISFAAQGLSHLLEQPEGQGAA